MRIGYDIDGVLADFTKGFNQKIKHRNPQIQTYSDRLIDHYDYKKFYGEEIVRKVWEDIARDEMFFERLLPDPRSSLEDVRVLHRYSHAQFYFLTNRKNTMSVQKQTHAWLKKHGMSSPKVIFTEDKAQVITEQNIDMFIDNNPRCIQQIDQKTSIDPHALLKRYNKDIDATHVGTVREFNDIARRYL